MSLINCPECGNECASDAVSCPKCGHPFVKPVTAQPRVIVREVEREDSFPKWVFIPLGLLGVIILFGIFYLLKKDDSANQRNINVNVATAKTPSAVTTTTTTVTEPTPNQIIVPPSTSQPSTITTTTVPPNSTTTVVEPPPTNKAVVNVEAQIASRSGTPIPVAREKFYLLDKDLESILAEANIEDETGQGLLNAFGMSVYNPSKYRQTNQKALAAIKPHIIYSTLTDASGKAELKDVKPSGYYLFGVHRTPNGFAIWSSPVSVNTGQNSLVIPPVVPTEVMDNDE